MANGSPNPVCASQTAGKVPVIPALVLNCRTGIRADWSGITSRPTTRMKSALRPGKSIHANA